MPVKLIRSEDGVFSLPRRTRRQSKRRCHIQGCGRKRPAYGTVCSRCLMLRWRANNPEESAFARLKESARKRGIPFLLEFHEFVIWGRARGYFNHAGRRAHCLSVDRIDQSGPYSLDNIQALTVSENSAKERARQLGNHPFFK